MKITTAALTIPILFGAVTPITAETGSKSGKSAPSSKPGGMPSVVPTDKSGRASLRSAALSVLIPDAADLLESSAKATAGAANDVHHTLTVSKSSLNNIPQKYLRDKKENKNTTTATNADNNDNEVWNERNLAATAISYAGTLVTIDRDRSAKYKSSLGLMFEIEAREDVSITSFSFFTAFYSKTLTEVYMRYGSYKGYTGNSYGWERIHSGKSQQQGTSSLTEVKLKTPVYIQQGITASFYIVTPGMIISVDSGVKEGKVIAQNDAIKLFTGIALAYGQWEEGCINGWQCTIFPGRSFEGIIGYNVFTSPSTAISTPNNEYQVIESSGALVTIDRDRSAKYKSSFGLMFEIEAREDVSITSFSFFTASDSKALTEVYMRYGSYKGYTGNSYGWERIHSGKSQQQGTSSLTEVKLKTPVYIQQGVTASFHIVTAGMIISVDSGVKEGKVIAQNDAIELYSGIALAYGQWEEGCMNGWQCTIFPGRSFEGIIGYNIFILLPTFP